MKDISEHWLAIEGYNGRYEVSDLGNVRTMHYGRWGGCRNLVSVPDKDGYRRVLLYKNAKSRHNKFVHQLVIAAFIGPRPDGLQVNHIDGIPDNNRIGNLEYVTSSENQLHAYRLGLSKPKCGELSNFAKLTGALVVEIKKLRAQGKTLREIAAICSVTQGAVSMAARGITWSHCAR